MFYIDFLCTWAELRYLHKQNVENIYHEMLWNNSNITINGQPLNFQEWKEAVILCVKEVINKGKWKDISFLIHLFTYTFTLHIYFQN